MKISNFLFLPLLALATGCAGIVQKVQDQKYERIHALANTGNAEAQYHVGMIFNNGMAGMPRDPRVAFEWFLKAEAGGNVLGSYKVGCYYAGQFPGVVEVDGEKALTYKLVAATAGYSIAQHDVGSIHVARKNYAEAERWYQLAANQGYPAANVALYTLYSKDEYRMLNPEMAYARLKLVARWRESIRAAPIRAELEAASARLTPAQLEVAEKFVAQFRSSPTELTLNAFNSRKRIDILLEEAKNRREADREARAALRATKSAD
jgi:uncharacterized protein